MALQLNYILDDHGWANLRLTQGGQTVDMTVSYLHDTLAELVTAANLLLKGASEAKVVAMDEPGEHLIYLQATDDLYVAVEVRWFRDWASWNLITEKEFEVVFKADCTIKNFAFEVFATAKAILDNDGLEGYKEKWMRHDFPIDEYRRLMGLAGSQRGIVDNV
jgi:hypothetical protein